MNDERLAQAVYNNAVWCDTVCRAHGRPGEFLEGIWINRHESSPFYPNAITLSDTTESAAQIAVIHELVQRGIPGEWGVKDSFDALDLAPLGFRPLFEATWLWRPATRLEPERGIDGVRWLRIKEASELARWERAWRGEPPDESNATHTRIFPPVLLTDDTIAVVAGYDQQRVVAGAIANRTGEVVGVSNLFVPPHDAARFRASCVATIHDIFPGLPLVGYNSGRDLDEMRALHFEELGPLRVWVRVHRSAPTIGVEHG